MCMSFAFWTNLQNTPALRFDFKRFQNGRQSNHNWSPKISNKGETESTSSNCSESIVNKKMYTICCEIYHKLPLNQETLNKCMGIGAWDWVLCLLYYKNHIIHITLFSDVGLQNIIVGCWEFSLKCSFLSISLLYFENPQNESCTLRNVMHFNIHWGPCYKHFIHVMNPFHWCNKVCYCHFFRLKEHQVKDLKFGSKLFRWRRCCGSNSLSEVILLTCIRATLMVPIK